MGARVSFPDGERLDTFKIEVEAIYESEESSERDILLNALKTLHKSVFHFLMTPNEKSQATLEQVWNMAGNTLAQIEGAINDFGPE